jgi:hypothetical protein
LAWVLRVKSPVMLRAEILNNFTFKLEIVLGNEESSKPWRHVPHWLVGLDFIPDILFGQFKCLIDLRQKLAPVILGLSQGTDH